MPDKGGKPRMRRVILETPFAGDVPRNVAFARACLADCLKRGDAAIASHLLYTQLGDMRDEIPEERELGIEAGLVWGRVAEATVVYTNLGLSRGVQGGIDRAKLEGRSVEFRELPPDWDKNERLFAPFP